MQMTELLQPDYNKHCWTIWQCRPVSLLNNIMQNHVMHRLLPLN